MIQQSILAMALILTVSVFAQAADTEPVRFVKSMDGKAVSCESAENVKMKNKGYRLHSPRLTTLSDGRLRIEAGIRFDRCVQQGDQIGWERISSEEFFTTVLSKPAGRTVLTVPNPEIAVINDYYQVLHVQALAESSSESIAFEISPEQIQSPIPEHRRTWAGRVEIYLRGIEWVQYPDRSEPESLGLRSSGSYYLLFQKDESGTLHMMLR